MNNAPQIAAGKFSQNWPSLLVLGAIGILNLSAGFYFLFLEGAGIDIAAYPLIGGIIFTVIALFIFLGQGHFQLTTVELKYGTRMGKPSVFELEEVGDILVEGENVEIRNPKGKKLRRMKKAGPDRAVGAMWMYHSYKDKLPRESLLKVGDKKANDAIPEGVHAAHRTLTRKSEARLEDRGIVLHHAGKWYYFPETGTASPGTALEALSPVVITRYIRTPGKPERHNLTFRPVLKSLLNSSYTDAEKAEFFGTLCLDHLGSIIEAPEDRTDNLSRTSEDGTLVELRLS